MADPKYANLPGIDLESPDIYETSSLPEEDQVPSNQDEPESENVEKCSINATDAYGKFKGKPVGAGEIDFSDRVGKSRRTGYDIPLSEYEMVGEGSAVQETPQQKYQRLQHEIRLLAEEVTKAQENAKADSSSDQLSPVNMSKQVEYLQQQISDLHLDKLLGDSGTVNLADPQGALQKRLLTELAGFQGLKVGEGPSPGGKAVQGVAAGDADHVSYQLYYRPEQAKFSNNARLADVEQRMERMEALLGSNPEKVSMLTADTSNKSLLGAVALLNAKTKLLDPAQVEQVEGRLHALGQRLSAITEKKASVEQDDRQAKVTELYDLVKKWDSLSDTVPHVVERLVALKELHERALEFSQALTQLDSAQRQISSQLGAHGDMIKQIQITIADNTAAIKSNFESLDARLKVLKK